MRLYRIGTPWLWQTGALAGDYRWGAVLQRRIRNKQKCNQHQSHNRQKAKSWHCRVPTAHLRVPRNKLSPATVLGRVGLWAYVKHCNPDAHEFCASAKDSAYFDLVYDRDEPAPVIEGGCHPMMSPGHIAKVNDAIPKCHNVFVP